MTTDEEHVRLLAIFHYVLAGVMALFSLFPLVHVWMGAMMLSGQFASPNEPAMPEAFGWMFITMGAVFVMMGLSFSVCVALAGWFLYAHRRYIFCMVIAALSCAFFPLGTILGVMTIVVLQRPPVRQLFEPPPAV